MSAPEKPSATAANDSGEFLSRWSRRKAQAREQQIADDDLKPEIEENEEIDGQLSKEQLEGLTDDEILQKLDLPDPETLKAGDDFTVFMKNAVPMRIRNRALRKLWLSDPTLANVDMLVDYGDDFTDAATVLPGMKTAYEVGKGIARRFEELAKEIPDTEEAEGMESSDIQSDDTELDGQNDELQADEDVILADVSAPDEYSSEMELQTHAADEELLEIELQYRPDRMKFSV